MSDNEENQQEVVNNHNIRQHDQAFNHRRGNELDEQPPLANQN